MTRSLGCVVVVVLALGCDEAPGGAAVAPRPAREPAGVVVRVNGVPISAREVALRQAPDAHAGTTAPGNADAVLEAMIVQELAAQRALALGLDADASFQREVENLEAQLAVARRKELARLYFKRELAERSKVTDDEARALFDARADQVGTQLHLFQILKRSRAEIDAAQAALAAGQDFVAVATGGEPVPGGLKPWDLGFLNWAQLPAVWRDVVYGLKDGEVSPVIEGQGGRFWVVKVIARRAAPMVGFDALRPMLVQALQAQRLETAQADVEKDLRANGRVERVAPKP